MPVVNPVIVPIFPDDREGIGSHCDHVVDARGGCIAQVQIEHLGVGFRSHVFVSATAGGTRAGCAQQFKRIDAGMIVAPGDREFSGFFIGSNPCWFFVHLSP